jgi:7,8-dihydropterin-6-yl-methyl-4-(beta-D-ribofuranosyl)aminobenzene 5'-phosphate synthase
MSVICVVDDAVQRSSPFWGEHGLAFLIEKEGRRLLFDTGQSGTVLLHNLSLLDIDPATIDAIAISHAHYDHTGGLPALLEYLRPGTLLYASPDLFRERFSQSEGQPKDVGLGLTREELAGRLALRLSAAPQEILPRLWPTGEISQRPGAEGRSGYHLMLRGKPWWWTPTGMTWPWCWIWETVSSCSAAAAMPGC